MKTPQLQRALRVTMAVGVLGLLGGAAGHVTAKADIEPGSHVRQVDGEFYCFGNKATIVGGQRVENAEGDADEQFTRVYINGTEGDDVIVGTREIDIVYAKGGDDRVCTLGGNDFVDGGDGFDLCAGDAGTDNVSDTCEWGARQP
jgi:Ca2+-binding RTX toxin-like protein